MGEPAPSRQRRLNAILSLIATVQLLAACGSSKTLEPMDAGGGDEDGSVEPDAGPPDAGPVPDAGPPPDGGPPPDAGPTCSLEVRGTLTLPSDLAMDTLRGESANTTTSCTPERGTQGPEHVYTLHVDDRTGVILRTTSATDTVLAIRTICDDPVSEVACNNDAVPFDPGNAELRAVLDPGDYFVIVDVHAFGIGGAYSLSLETFEPAPNARCEDAIPVMDGTVLVGEDTSTSVPSRIDCGGMFPPLEGNMLYYRATIPSSHRLEVEAMSPFGPVEVRFLDDCALRTCIGDFAPFPGARMSYINTGAERDVIIAVWVATPPPRPGEPPMPATFDLTVRIEPLPEHVVCSMARTVTDGSVETGDTSLGDPTPVSCASPMLPPIRGVHYYAATVPAGHALRASARPAGGPFTELGVLVLGSCGGSCLASSDGMTRPESTVLYRNTGAVPIDVVLAVGNLEFAPPGLFELSVSIVPLPTNVTCATAITVTDGSMVGGDTDIGGSDTVSCARTISNVLYYTATIPAGHTLGAEITSSAPVEAGILSGCGGSCLASSMRSPAGTFVYRTNTGTTPVSVILAVGRSTFGAGGPFSMRVSIQPAPMNVTCATATVVGDGDSLALQDARAAADDLSAVCEPSATGGALYYRATVPPGETVRATVTPAEGWRAVLRILPACGATSCLAWSTPMFGGTTASWTNTGTTSTDVILAAGAWDTSFTGYFRLDVSIGPPPYAESTVAASCDDVSAGTAVTGVLGDDAVSPTLALPFAAPFFGASMTHFAVTTNGVLHLWPSASTPRPFAAYSNMAIPTAGEPNSMVAALWDDLAAPPGSAVRTQVLGTGADRRVVFEWSGFEFLSDAASDLTFQVKLFESGVVEVHYCGLTPGSDASRATGGSATVGLENALGTDGTQHSFNMPGSIGTTDALRFTPAP